MKKVKFTGKKKLWTTKAHTDKRRKKVWFEERKTSLKKHSKKKVSSKKRSAKFKKGSAEAKRYMAKLRAMKK